MNEENNEKCLNGEEDINEEDLPEKWRKCILLKGAK
jgi:hypothetical protein